jgi:hypothetical protein
MYYCMLHSSSIKKQSMRSILISTGLFFNRILFLYFTQQKIAHSPITSIYNFVPARITLSPIYFTGHSKLCS